MDISPMTNRVTRLSDLLTADQLTLMLDLLRRVCVSGYGIFAIEIMDGKVRFYRVTFSISALPVSRNEQKG
jgi:hypothetical protein